LFYYFCLEDQVPENHLLRLIEKHISFAFVRERLKDSYRRPAVRRLIQSFCTLECWRLSYLDCSRLLPEGSYGPKLRCHKHAFSAENGHFPYHLLLLRSPASWKRAPGSPFRVDQANLPTSERTMNRVQPCSI
jgi:hypothetical protein